MQEHPVPRQITTFEFKLIGELTLKQFGYLAGAAVFTILIYFLLPSTLYLNIIFAAIPALMGIGFAFVPVNERPMDVWLKNLVKRMSSASQYYYKKNNKPPKILLGVVLPPKEQLEKYLTAQQKLNEYLQKKPKTSQQDVMNSVTTSYDERKTRIKTLFAASYTPAPVEPAVYTAPPTDPVVIDTSTATVEEASTPLPPTEQLMPTTEVPVVTAPVSTENIVMRGTVYSPNGVPLPGILVYLKQGNEVIRLFKTDKEGMFLTNIAIPPGEYTVQTMDPQKKYLFATMKITSQQTQLEIFAQQQ